MDYEWSDGVAGELAGAIFANLPWVVTGSQRRVRGQESRRRDPVATRTTIAPAKLC
jgi:hypothetical protein